MLEEVALSRKTGQGGCWGDREGRASEGLRELAARGGLGAAGIPGREGLGAGLGVVVRGGIGSPTLLPSGAELHRVGEGRGAALWPATGAAGPGLPPGGAGGAPWLAGGASGPATQPG